MVTLKNNTVNHGDIVGGDKILIVKKEIATAISSIRGELGFDPKCDQTDTTLLKKLKDGKFNADSIRHAKRVKIRTLGVLYDIIESEEGKKIVADLYENLITVINAKHIADMEPDDLLKTKMSDIYGEFTSLVNKYQNLINVDEAFLDGLLFIATSNCAMRWKIEDYK